MNCYIPENLTEALEIRKKTHAVPMAGGTDLMVQAKKGIGINPAFKTPIMIISYLSELKGIKVEDDGTLVIGSLATSSEIADDERVFYPIRKAASLMGAVSLRNTATIGGNIANASPKGDLPQPLILLDAELILSSIDRERMIKVDDFIIGAKKTVLQDDEIIKEVRIKPVKATHYFYHKIGTRKANAISKLSLSILADVEDGILKDFRASSGASGDKVKRSRDAEMILIGKPISEIASHIDEFTSAWDRILSPHAMPQYRRESTRRMLSDFLIKLSEGAEPGIYE